MAEIIKIKKGLDIPLYGKADSEIVENVFPSEAAIVPDDFPGYIWKSDVKPGDKVSIGTPLMHAKENENINLVSPASGTVKEIHRGERRHIEAIVVATDSNNEAEAVKMEIPSEAEGLKAALCRSGMWVLLRQRPYNIIPDPEVKPRDIFITGFDSAPLAPEMVNPAEQNFLERGIEALSMLTDGKVYLSIGFGSGISSKTAETIEFEGPHPSGNVGTQIAAIKPVNKGEIVWTADASAVVAIGRFLAAGTIDTKVKVAVTGEGISNPHYVNTIAGASIADIMKKFTPATDKNLRYISGNVLTGSRIDPQSGFLRFPYRQITVIQEGDTRDEFMGWASVNPSKYSVKRSFPAFLRGLGKPFHFDSRLKGGRRAMIVSGEYDKVFPLDIYPEYLIKAILANDIDRMEQLGIYEVAPEDFALAEFVDTSKLPLQQIVDDGLKKLRKELQ